MNKIRKGDEVIVLTGKDKGKRGVVQAVQGDKVVVEGVNVAKKHARPNPMLGTTGGVVDKLMPLHISNVALVDANGKPSRVGIQEVDGKRVRVLWQGAEYRGRGRQTIWDGGCVLTGNKFEKVTPINFWNLDKTLDQVAPGELKWGGLTTGGFAGFDAWLADPAAGTQLNLCCVDVDVCVIS